MAETYATTDATHVLTLEEIRNLTEEGGKPEFLASDGTGKVFINLEDKDLVAVVDLKSGKVINRWPVAPGGAPVGMALDPASHNLVNRMPQAANDGVHEHGNRQDQRVASHRRRRPLDTPAGAASSAA